MNGAATHAVRVNGVKEKSSLRILVSGASVAGPVLAYWLTRHGFSVTVVERAPALTRPAGTRWTCFWECSGVSRSGLPVRSG